MLSESLKTHPRLWATSFLIWLIVLCLLSHGDRFHPPIAGYFLEFANIDKVVHFGYFFGGGGLLAAYLHFSRELSPRKLLLIVTILLSIVGVGDEFHQSFFKNRTGNDPGDWLFDTLGAFCGALVFLLSHRFLLKLPDQKEKRPQA
jgi:hypothetical protein